MITLSSYIRQKYVAAAEKMQSAYYIKIPWDLLYLSSNSRGTLMSYADQSAQRCVIYICGAAHMTASRDIDPVTSPSFWQLSCCRYAKSNVFVMFIL